MRAGANVKATNRYGVTPMYSAAVNGNAAMIELLLNAGADPNVALAGRRDGADDRGAHRQGRRPCGVLLARGATVNAKENMEAADGADVGGARRQRRGGEAAARGRRAT